MVEKINNPKLTKSPDAPEPVASVNRIPVETPRSHEMPQEWKLYLKPLSPEREADFLAELLGASLASHIYQVQVETQEETHEVVKLVEELLPILDPEQTETLNLAVVLSALFAVAVNYKAMIHGIKLSPAAVDTVLKIVKEAGVGVEKEKQDHIQLVHDVMKESFPKIQAILKTKGITARRDDQGVGLFVSRDGKQASADDMQAVSDVVRTMVKEKEKEA
jgi:hypothetical protein